MRLPGDNQRPVKHLLDQVASGTGAAVPDISETSYGSVNNGSSAGGAFMPPMPLPGSPSQLNCVSTGAPCEACHCGESMSEYDRLEGLKRLDQLVPRANPDSASKSITAA